MRRQVLDASVALAWYLPEDFASAARALQSDLLEGSLGFIVPSFHYWEVGNVLRRYVRRGELASDLAEELYALHLDAPLEVADPDRGEVLKIALDYEATVYDAV